MIGQFEADRTSLVIGKSRGGRRQGKAGGKVVKGKSEWKDRRCDVPIDPS